LISSSDQLLAEAVALLHDLDDRAGLNAVDGLGGESLMRLRIELLPSGIDNLDPIPLQRLPQRAKHQQHSMRQPVLRVTFRIQPRSLQRPLQIVQHGQHIPRKLPLPASGSRLNIRGHPLPEVLEIGLSPLRQVQVLISLALRVSQQRIEIRLDLIGLSRGWHG
jgi:hypothetical protein